MPGCYGPPGYSSARTGKAISSRFHDPLLNELSLALTGAPYTDFFVDANGNPVTFDPRFPERFLLSQDQREDEQYAAFGELTYGLTERLKATVGARFSRTKFSFDTLTGGPQLFDVPRTGSGNNRRIHSPRK